MFDQARIKLTLVYLALVLFVTGSLSGVFYVGSMRVIRGEFRLIEQRLQLQDQRSGLGPRPEDSELRLQVLAENLESARHQIIFQLLRINVVVAVVILIAGYYLSGKTLEPIENSMKQQKKFVADASHELKTPVAALRTSLEVNLMDKKLSRSTRQILEENLEDVMSLERLVGSLLNLARVDAQKIQLATVKLQPVIERALRHTRPLADHKKIKLKVEWDDDLKSSQVMAEENGLLEVLMILIDNAIKNSVSGKKVLIAITKGSRSRIQRHELVEIAVIDQGEGIPAQHLAHIFDRFYQVDQSRTRDSNLSQGYGLGLSLAQEIIQQFRGKLSVTSESGKGSTFQIQLHLV